MHLEIVTPDKTLFEGTVTLIQVPGSKGRFQVLQYHASIISTLDKGQIKVDGSGGLQYFDIESGIIEVQRNEAIILAEGV